VVFSPKIYKEDDVIDFHLILKTNVDLFREYGVVVDFNNTFDRSSMKLRRSRLDAIDVVNLVLFDYSNPTYISNGRVVDSLR
jgi:hypothetical protein